MDGLPHIPVVCSPFGKHRIKDLSVFYFIISGIYSSVVQGQHMLSVMNAFFSAWDMYSIHNLNQCFPVQILPAKRHVLIINQRIAKIEGY
ncbi:hypothetical protein D3C86_1708960 [compost metagenome]